MKTIKVTKNTINALVEECVQIGPQVNVENTKNENWHNSEIIYRTTRGEFYLSSKVNKKKGGTLAKKNPIIYKQIPTKLLSKYNYKYRVMEENWRNASEGIERRKCRWVERYTLSKTLRHCNFHKILAFYSKTY